MCSPLYCVGGGTWLGPFLTCPRYREDLQGVLVLADNLSITQSAAIVEDSPFLHAQLQGRGLLFKPSVGSVVWGTISSVSSGYATALVAGLFNARISLDDLRDRYTWQAGLDQWQLNSGHAGQQLPAVIAAGERIPLAISAVSATAGVITLETTVASNTDAAQAHDNAVAAHAALTTGKASSSKAAKKYSADVDDVSKPEAAAGAAGSAGQKRRRRAEQESEPTPAKASKKEKKEKKEKKSKSRKAERS